tara:strand:+ start:2407 stop:4254 length:1848 start_codon:yes stop_codon:yes gene_type:complete
MCGICGVVNFDQSPVNSKSLMIMNDSMINRGPDDQGFLIDNNFGFAMRRLSIIDLKNGKQPIKSSNGRFVIVFNGELYNYIELKKELIKKNYHFSTNSDTEVVVNYFQEKGIDGIVDFNGMFAIAIWDNHNRELFLIRDKVGIKPLYFTNKNRSFVFCSSLDGIQKYFKGRLEIDNESIFKYLAFSYIPFPYSIFKNVYKIKPGHFIKINTYGEINEKEYWSKKTINPNNNFSLENKSDIIELLNDSIQMQMRSDVPIGTFLSGGVDSSAVVALLSKNSSDRINTFSIGFKDGLNELPQAKMIAKKYNTVHHEFFVTPLEMIQNLSVIIDNLDEPLSDNSLFPTYHLSKFAVDHGIKVILNGSGGDELFGGYIRHLPNDYKRKLLKNIPQRIKNIISNLINNQKSDGLEIILNPGFDFYRGISGISLEFLSIILPDASNIETIKNFIQSSYYSNHYDLNDNRSPQSLMLLDFNDYLVNDVLSVLDKMTMAVSLEGRVPILDHRLVDLSFNIPQKEIFYNNQRKGLFNYVLRDLLPKEIFNQPKSGFAMPINNWVNSGFNSIIKEKLLYERNHIVDDFFDSKQISNLISQEKIQDNFSNMFFSLFILNEWLNNKIN